MVAYLAYRSHQHTLDQEAIAANLVKQLIPLWQFQDFNDLDRSTPLFLTSAIPHVRTAYLQSQVAQAVYSNDVRMASLPDEVGLPMAVPHVELPDNVIPLRFDTTFIPHVGTPDQPVVHFDDFPARDANVSLAITSNYGIKSQMPGPEDELMRKGLSNTAGAAVRHAMNGGRSVANNLVQFDRKVIGYARVTDTDPCAFCALLASRGAVYGKGSFVEGNRKFKPNKEAPEGLPDEWFPCRTHDHCRCYMRPVYSQSQAMDADAKFYRKQWQDVRDEWYWLSNKKQIQKFREQYTPFERPEADIHDVADELKKRVAGSAGRFSPQAEWASRQLDQLA